MTHENLHMTNYIFLIPPQMLAQQESHCQLCQLVNRFGAWLQGHVVHYLEPQVIALSTWILR